MPHGSIGYQTIFAAHDGAVAAPTAGLHFTPALLEALERCGVKRVTITLHVGAGTFLPVRCDDIARHRMYAERGAITVQAAAAINAARAAGRRVVAVGTTSLRLLETAAAGGGCIRPFAGDTALFIVPGYRFRAVDLLLTNFHLPRSTPVHAGLRLCRHRADAHRVYTRDRGGVSLLLLRRRLPAGTSGDRILTTASPPPTAPRAPAYCTPRMARCRHRRSCRSAPPGR